MLSRLAAIRDYISNEWIGSVPFVGLRMWFYNLIGVSFAERSSTAILMHCEMIRPRGISIGARTVVGRECILDGRGRLSIGRDVNIGGRTQFFTGTHDRDDPQFSARYEPITVEDHVWVAVGSIVLGGVTIGRGAVVAAGSVVTSDVEPMAIYAGVPARRIGQRGIDPAYELSYRPNGF